MRHCTAATRRSSTSPCALHLRAGKTASFVLLSKEIAAPPRHLHACACAPPHPLHTSPHEQPLLHGPQPHTLGCSSAVQTCTVRWSAPQSGRFPRMKHSTLGLQPTQTCSRPKAVVGTSVARGQYTNPALCTYAGSTMIVSPSSNACFATTPRPCCSDIVHTVVLGAALGTQTPNPKQPQWCVNTLQRLTRRQALA